MKVLRCLFCTALFALALLSLPLFALAQAVSYGPFAVYGTNAWSNVRMPPNSLLSGAIGPILTSKTDPDKFVIGAVNGGVWSTRDGGQSWNSLSASMPALSIGAMSFDAYDANTLYAGVGLFSNYASVGGQKIGLMGSTDAGASWSTLGGRTLLNTNISSITAAGNTILVGSVRESESTPGLFRSVDGGRTFQNILGTGGLPSGRLSVTSVASDPSNPARVYAVLNGNGVYRSDNGGWTWSNVSAGMTFKSGDKNAKISVGANGSSLFVGIVGPSGKLTEVWNSTNYGASWRSMGTGNTLPGSTEGGVFYGIMPGAQGFPNFSLMADPNNPNLVYIGGDRQPAADESSGGSTFPNSQGATSYTANLFRGDAAQPLGGQWTSITNSATNSTASHADSRTLAVDASGNVIESDDGGINRLSSRSNTWSSINGNLSVAELHSIAYDPVSRLLLAGAQDIGTLRQNSTGSSIFSDVGGGDGGKVAVVTIQSGPSSGNSIQYSSNGNLGGFTRTQFSTSGMVGSPVSTTLKVGAVSLYAYERSLNDGNTYLAIAPYRGNAIAGLSQGLAFGTGTIYWGQDSNPTSTTLSLTDVGPTPGTFFDDYVSGLSFTQVAGKAAILAGAGSNLYYSPDVMTANTAKVANYSGGSISDVLLTGSTSTGMSSGEFFVLGTKSANYNSVLTSTDGGSNWSTRISRYGLGALKDVPAQGGFVAVGGYGEVWAARDAYLDDWYLISRGLPNVRVTQIASDDTSGVLYLSTLGRGIWSIPLTASTVPTTPASILESGHLRILRSTSADQVLNGGILQTPDDLNSGVNIGLLSGGGTLDTTDRTVTLSGVVSGAGGLIKAGTGTLTLGGANTHQGGTALNGGTTVISNDANLGAPGSPLSFDGGNLQLSSNWTSPRPVTLNSGWGGIDTANNNASLSGVISGVGGIYKLGQGTFTLSGVNTYQGGTYISGGTLSIASDANLGAAGSTLVLDGGTLQTTAGITSTRILYVSPNGGTLDAQGNTSTLKGLFYGSGPFTQTGAGTVTLSGDGTYYTGTATIASGRFNLASTTLGGTLDISQGAWLTGNGTVGNLKNAGAVSPGNSIGLITVAGNYEQSPSGNLIIEMNSSGAVDQLRVLGTATLAGSLSVHPLRGGYYRTGLSSYNFFSAQGGVLGGFTNLNLTAPYSPVLGFSASANDGTITMAVSRSPYAAYASNQRQIGVGNALNQIAFNATGDMTTVYSVLDFGPPAGITQALSQLNPEPYDALTQSAFTLKRQYASAIHSHLYDLGSSSHALTAFRGVFDGGSPALLAARGGLGEVGPIAEQPQSFDTRRLGLFLEPFGVSENQQNMNNRTGYRAGAAGFMGGGDYRLTEQIVLGAFAGYAQSGLKLRDQLTSKGSLDNYSIGLFASASGQNWFANAVGSIGVDSYRLNRGLAFPGVMRTAVATYQGLDASFSANGGYTWSWGKFKAGPVAALDSVGLWTPGYSEAKAWGLGLNIGPQNNSSLKSGLGAQLRYDVQIGESGCTLSPELSVLWDHEYLNGSRRINAELKGAPGNGFSTPTSEPGRDSVKIKAGIAGTAFKRKLGFYTRFECEQGRPGNDVKAISGGLQMSF